jgi:hypothetical protein
MRFIIGRRRPARLAIAVVCAVLVSGCGGQATDSTAAPTTSTLPPTTTIPPLTAEEVAWLDGLSKMAKTLEEKKNKIYGAGTTAFTRAEMVSLAKVLGSCSRELARLGAPSDRLQPVATLAKKACQQLRKAAKCQATVASVSDASGGVVVGSPQQRTWERAGRCAEAADKKATQLLEDAQAKGHQIRATVGVG